MSNNSIPVFARTVQKSEAWIADIHNELNWIGAEDSYRLLRSVLQALRDQLSIDEAAQLSAQLPLLLRGVFYDCWDPKAAPPARFEKKEFLEDVKHRMEPVTQLNYDIEEGVCAVLHTMLKHVSGGEMHDIFVSMKPSVQTLLQKAKNRSAKKTHTAS